MRGLIHRFVNWAREMPILLSVLGSIVLFIVLYAYAASIGQHWLDITGLLPDQPKASVNRWQDDVIVWTMFAAVLVILGLHLFSPGSGPVQTGAIPMSVLFLVTLFVHTASRPTDLWTLLASVIAMGMMLFVIGSELLTEHEWGRVLTKEVGEQWVKQMEYFYLLFGAVGVIGSLTKIPNISGHIAGLEIIYPLFITVAITIKLIKTRAEINEWNKESFYVNRPWKKSALKFYKAALFRGGRPAGTSRNARAPPAEAPAHVQQTLRRLFKRSKTP
jgi:hypothetical protein